jgi:hypothetical protein
MQTHRCRPAGGDGGGLDVRRFPRRKAPVEDRELRFDFQNRYGDGDRLTVTIAFLLGRGPAVRCSWEAGGIIFEIIT